MRTPPGYEWFQEPRHVGRGPVPVVTVIRPRVVTRVGAVRLLLRVLPRDVPRAPETHPFEVRTSPPRLC